LARWGSLFDIAVEVVPDVECTVAGKHRFVVSRLQPGQ
jgi:hypothetical protein